MRRTNVKYDGDTMTIVAEPTAHSLDAFINFLIALILSPIAAIGTIVTFQVGHVGHSKESASSHVVMGMFWPLFVAPALYFFYPFH